ncbi:hypothetical protein [Planctomycetes bacterium TBK1r]|uniref:Metal-binding protein n=1 Tax=Stieleria magnilauensis TaxID=2527963 RepID=A0ABX5XZM9_9BACT|nr:hypothetical protein TBK1r_59990 [Planctomycetes bacterium TBK1r]QDV87050.1 hypothetical protein TBK1r_60770 [Planctomycetes bacterium TBK1r]
MTNPNWPHASSLYTEAIRILDANGNRVDTPPDETWDAQAEPVHVFGMRLIETHFPKCECATTSPARCERCWRLEHLEDLLQNPYEDKQ